jgi:chemotaxis protein CheZ
MNSTNTAGKPLPEELRALLESNDGDAFESALEALLRSREQHVFRALGHVARELHDSVKRLAADVTGDSTDDRGSMSQRLQEVLDMSAQAAHRNLTMVETLRPRAQALASSAAKSADPLADEAAAFANDCCSHFDELVESQSWQDLSGQRVKQVATFIDTVESSLLELVRVAGSLAGTASAATAAVERASTQDEVDRLLAEFGF